MFRSAVYLTVFQWNYVESIVRYLVCQIFGGGFLYIEASLSLTFGEHTDLDSGRFILCINRQRQHRHNKDDKSDF